MNDIIDVKQTVKRLNEEEDFLSQNRIPDRYNRGVNDSPLPIPLPKEDDKPREKWECPACTLINFPWKLLCEACITRRPDPAGDLKSLKHETKMDEHNNVSLAKNESKKFK